jgi:FkbM family methyltransferase
VSTVETRKRFLEDRRREVYARGLMLYPRVSEHEEREVEAFARLFDALDSPFVVRHPMVDLRVELSKVLGPRVAYLIVVGDYELTDLELIEAHVRKGDRVLELGGGAGLTAALCARVSGQPVAVAEADDRLIPLIRRQVELNSGAVSFEHGVVLGGAGPDHVDFFLDEDPWVSSVEPEAGGREGSRERRKISVPVLRLDTLLTRHRPTVLMVDIEGAERELFLSPLSYAPRLIIIEVHTPHYGERVSAQMIQRIVDLGYRLVDQKGWTCVFERR